MEKLKKFIKTSFGSGIPIRYRFFNIIFMMGILVGIAGVFACINLNSSIQAITISAVMTLAFPLLAYVGIRSKSKQNRVIILSLCIVNLLIFPALYLSGGAIDCGIPSYFVLGIALTLFLSSGTISYVLSAIFSIWYGFIFFVSWKWPEVCIDVPAFEASATGRRDFAFNAISSNSLMVCIALAMLAKVIFSLYQTQVKKIEANIVEVERQSIIDPLTTVYNRRHMYAYLEEQFELASQNKTPLSVLLFDIDFFKRLNDNYGHLTGDAVLKALARILKNACGENEIVTRYGGEEFLIILPGVEKDKAVARAEEIRRVVEESYLSPDLPRDTPVTISGGVATLRPGDTNETLVARVDHNLYRAKENGRNRICSEEVES
ncbi:MAG: diguanylate cyclase [Clostridia bacterium]|nr:diguanylate cyclase [Clostridia bacterium]